jgi:hypothetical protein
MLERRNQCAQNRHIKQRAKNEQAYTNNLHSSIVNLFTISIASNSLLSVSFHCQLELLKLYSVDVTSDNSNH